MDTLVHLLHVLAVGKQRQHRSTHSHMHIRQQLFEVIKICIVISKVGSVHVGRNDNCHIAIEIVARVQVQCFQLIFIDSIESYRFIEMCKAFIDRHGCGREYHALGFGKPKVRKRLADIEHLCCKRLITCRFTLVELKRIDVGAIRALDNQAEIVLALMECAR